MTDKTLRGGSEETRDEKVFWLQNFFGISDTCAVRILGNLEVVELVERRDDTD